MGLLLLLLCVLYWGPIVRSHAARRAWPILRPGTVIPKVTVAQAQTGSTTGSGASSSGPDRSVTGSGASRAASSSAPPAPAPAAAPTTAGDLPKKLAEAHPDDKAELV